MREGEIEVIDADEGEAAERAVGQRSPRRRLLLHRPLTAIVVAFAWRLLRGGAHRPARAPLLAYVPPDKAFVAWCIEDPQVCLEGRHRLLPVQRRHSRDPRRGPGVRF